MGPAAGETLKQLYNVVDARENAAGRRMTEDEISLTRGLSGYEGEEKIRTDFLAACVADPDAYVG